MEIYVAKDTLGFRFFKDCPDLVKFSSESPLEWTGYPLDFGDFSKIQNLVMKDKRILALEEYDNPLRVEIVGLTLNVL